jgi:ABC-type transport system substrate-binding protein
VAYLTLADSLFILVYVLSMLCVGASVLAAGLTRYGRLKVAVWSDRICRPAFFFGALIAVWIALPEATSVVVDEVDPVPEMAREASERQELRIGTNLTVRRAANPVFYAASWPLVYEEPHGGERWPVFVERAPGVDNAAVRFLAGGELEVEWRLREGIRWSDGEPVTVEDLTLPLEASPDPAIREVFESDDRTVVLVWEERVARALEAPSVWPAHVLREVYEEEGYDGALEARREGNPPTLGPYRIVSFDEDHLRAEANPYFIGPAPNIRTVEVRRYADREALKEAFLEGEVDITLPNGVTGEHLEEVEARRPGTANRRASAIMALLQPDLSHPLLGDREIRRSILMAIDRGRLAEVPFGRGMEGWRFVEGEAHEEIPDF